ncbi:MAG: DUF4915 domain-containing protein [Chloroflexi bacterium]|nr:DUF4915 domain-containing protein [Chloroflexota bacterium]
MSTPSQAELDELWAMHDAAWRQPAQVASQWHGAAEVDPKILRWMVTGEWWETLARLDLTLLVTREYEHLAMALSAPGGKPHVSYMPTPHPAGIAVDREGGAVYMASTRNPNQVFELRPVHGLLPRAGMEGVAPDDCPLLPVRSAFYPGCFYLHDLAFIGGQLHAASAGQNVIVKLAAGRAEVVWWPCCVDDSGAPRTDRNYIQLNSIAAAESLERSHFSASTDHAGHRRPGHRNFPVDKRGVIFDGATREPLARGLTRPHSARLHEGRVWVDNSGYGELSVVEGSKPEVAAHLPGWTRGLCFHQDVAFVGTSRVIPRFRSYAPGLEPDDCRCGVHAVEVASGRVLGSIVWPFGNQIFALEWLPRPVSSGFPFVAGHPRPAAEKALFYSFDLRSGRA